MKRRRDAARLCLLAWIVALGGLRAETTNFPPGTRDLGIEDLINIQVTSVSKKEQRLADAAAAVFVLEGEDLRRSGATSVAESLRMVPGMQVAQVNSSQWAISARGFNSIYANGLLVLVDGRAVYTPIFAGVYWDLQQTMLENIDRIEVIRGPGATMWGANAVNGVINVVTASARDTQGTELSAGGGDVHQTMAGARYGGKLDNQTFYRIYGGYQKNEDFHLANGKSAEDGWQGAQGGFRLDHYADTDSQLTWQGEATFSDLDRHTSEAYNLNTLARLRHEFSERSAIELQTYYDRTLRDEVLRPRNTVDTVDFSLQHTFGLGERNDVIWGAGYRFMANKIDASTELAEVRRHYLNLQLFSAFVQDELKIIPDKVTLTAGVKIEHNDFTGCEIQPTVRLACKPTEHQTLWAAVSRAVRTPDELEDKGLLSVTIGEPFAGPGGTYLPRLVTGPDLKSENLLACEVGYRIQPSRKVSIDLAAFYNDYQHSIGVSPFLRFYPGSPIGIAEAEWRNNETATSYGTEVSVTISPTDHWRLTASYWLLLRDVDGAVQLETADPRHQFALRSSLDLGRRASVDAQLRYVEQFDGVPTSLTADVRLGFRLTQQLELSLVGQNLFNAAHLEQGSPPLAVTAETWRGFTES
ncbi:MAG: TonB-dependent receptor [Verrucomicrobiota bacterium]